MKNKSMLLALGASLSLGLANVATAEISQSFQSEKLNSGYNHTDANIKLAEGKCGAGKCGAGKCGGSDDDKGDKKGDGKCGHGKCGG